MNGGRSMMKMGMRFIERILMEKNIVMSTSSTMAVK